jgi:hypothetical protein
MVSSATGALVVLAGAEVVVLGSVTPVVVTADVVVVGLAVDVVVVVSGVELHAPRTAAMTRHSAAFLRERVSILAGYVGEISRGRIQ